MDARKVVHASGATRLLRGGELAAWRAAGSLRNLRAPARSPVDPAALRLVAFTPTYVPAHRRGAEVTLHAELVELVRRGHRAQVVVGRDGAPGRYDGVDVTVPADRRTIARLCDDADVLLAQLGARQHASRLAAYHRRPLVYFVQIGNVDRRALAGSPALTVFSSRAVRSTQEWVSDALVVHPPIDPMAYRTTPGDAVTLVNLGAGKGAEVFWSLARRHPDRRFLGVRAAGPQVVRDPVPPNVELVGPVADMRTVYGRTRVLLAPSMYESYGRVALEAAASGIPTIARPVAGLREAMEDAALWIDRDDPDAWSARLQELDDAAVYEHWSRRARERFDVVARWFTPELDALEAALVALATGGHR